MVVLYYTHVRTDSSFELIIKYTNVFNIIKVTTTIIIIYVIYN